MGWSLKIGILLLDQDSRPFELVRRVVEGSLYKGQPGHFLAWLSGLCGLPVANGQGGPWWVGQCNGRKYQGLSY